MSLHKLTAGDGYVYLIRQVAAGDSTERGYDSLGDYYAARGEAPGVWAGAGLSGLGGVAGTVTEKQMQNLFGLGVHPNADQIIEDLTKQGSSAQAAVAATRLGAAYQVIEGNPQWRERLAERYRAWNTVRGAKAGDKVPAEERERIRTDTALEMFLEQHGRAPLHDGELSAFFAQQTRLESSSVAGFDLTFSPVKSVSALWAVADPALSRHIEDAHHAAVAKTIGFLESRAVYTRLGARGVRQVDVTGLVAAQFTHRDSRAGDPDLHTHVAVSNKVQTRESGRWLALDGRMLYRFNVAASEFYNSTLEAEITTRIGGRFAERDVSAGKRPIRELAGVDQRLNDRWSTRRQAIEAGTADLAAEFVVRHGRVPSPVETLRLAQRATLATRKAKHEPRSLTEQRRLWHAEAVQVLGGAEQQLHQMLTQVHATVAAEPITAGLVDELAADTITVVSRSRARWRESNLLAEAIRQVRAVGIEPGMVTDYAAAVVRRAMAADHSVAIGADQDVIADPDVPAALRRADGSSQFRVAHSQLFTSPAVLDAEAGIIAAAGCGGARTVAASDVELAMLEWSANNDGRTLNSGQELMVRQIAAGDRLVHLALAPAGTGKTTVMGVLTRAWQAGGGHAIGLAPQASAAEELRSALHDVDTDTVDKLVHEITTTPEDRWPGWIHAIGKNTLVIVDEAGLASTLNLNATVAFVTGRGGRVLLVGDDRQRAAAGAGGVLRDVDAEHGSSSLVEVMRFTDPTEGQATLAVREGDPGAAGFYADRGRLHAVTADTGIDALYAAWRADISSGHHALMIAAGLDQVAQLNARARADRLADNPTGPERTERELVLPNGEAISAGDTVITKKNARSLSLGGTDFVQNNHRWTVTDIHADDAVTVRMLGGGRAVRLPAWYVQQGNVRLGYADTLASVQGRTVGSTGRVGTVHVLVGPDMTRNELYVALSRAVTATHLYLVGGGGIDPHQVITPQAVQPDTVVEAFISILSRDGSARSATTEIREAGDPARQLEHAAPAYREANTAACEALIGPERVAALTAAAESAVPGVTNAPAWDTLRGHLATLALTGQDPLARLTVAAVSRELRTARDLAAVLDYRLDRTGNHSLGAGPLPWLPAVPRAALDHPEWGGYLTAWTNRISDHCAAITAATRTWTAETAPAWAVPYLTDPALVTELALWRASQAVADSDLRPAGESPRRIADRRRHRELGRRCAAVAGVPGDGADRWARILHDHGVTADLGRDDFWPVLAGRLNVAEAAGLPVAQQLAAATEGQPLPVEAVASALWWRLAAHLGAATSPMSAQKHRVRPPWTQRITERLGEDTTERITADRLWPAVVAAVDAAARAGVDPNRLVSDAVGMAAPHLPDLPAHTWTTVLLWHAGVLTDPAPVDTGHDRVPPDPADADRIPPADLYDAIPEPDPRDLSTVVDEPAGSPSDEEPPAVSPPDPAAETTAPPPDLAAADQTVVVDRARAAVATAWDYFLHQAPRSWVPAYLASRGLDSDGVGYAPPGWTRALDHLQAAGFTGDELLAAGLARTSSRGTLIDPFRNRLMLPIHDAEGRVVAFIGRAHPSADHSVPKYLNSPGTVLFRKSDLPYGLEPGTIDRLRAGANLAIVEGPLDARAVQVAARHIGNDLVVVAPLGTALTASQLATLDRIAPLAQRPVLVAFDPDPAGQRAAAAAYPLLINAGVTAPRVPRLPSGLDAADLLARDGVEALVHALDQRRPLADVVVDQLTAGCPPEATAWERVRVLDAIAPIVGAMPSTQRARQAARVARITGLDAFTVLDAIQRHVPYDPTPRGPLGLPTPPKLRSQRDTLAAVATKIEAMRSVGIAAPPSGVGRRTRDRGEVGRDPL